jgi:hypothetical protein
MTRICETPSSRIESQAIEAAVQRIRNRIQPSYRHRLVVGRVMPPIDRALLPSSSYYYLAELVPKRWLGIVPYHSRRILLAVSDQFWDWVAQDRRVSCRLMESGITATVREEFQRLADSREVPMVNIVEEFRRGE